MRTLLLITLLASAAAAPAQMSDGRGDGEGRRAERSADRSDSRPQRREARRAEPQADQSSPSTNEEAPQPRPQALAPRNPEPRNSEPRNSEPRRIDARESDAPSVRREAGDTVRTWRQRDRPDSPSAVEQANIERAINAAEPEDAAPAVRTERRRSIADGMRRAPGANQDRVFDRQVRTTPGIAGGRVGRIGRNVPAEGTAPPPPTRAQVERGQTTRHWRGDWRRDGRYDWRRHRDRNRARFHLGFYFDPFGWSYRRYGIGWRLWPSYYHSSYWLHDPWYYRLPPAYGPYRWIRYHDDALLVNIYTGEVVDVLYDFFW